jgi:hypothetical protein
MSTKFGIASILKNFKVLPDGRTQYPLKYDPTNIQGAVEGGDWVRFEKL